MAFRRYCSLVIALTVAGIALLLTSGASAQGPCSPSAPQYCPPPKVKTGPAKHVTSTSATLTGTVNPNGSATTCFFEYGKTKAYGSTTPTQNVGSGTKTVHVSAKITGLTPKTTYHYRLVCKNLGGQARGKDRKIHGPPEVTTERAKRHTSESITFRGTVNPNGSRTKCMFKYGLTDSYGSSTQLKSVGSGTNTKPFTARVAGLAPKTVYHFRLFCTNVGGTRKGRDRRSETKNQIRFRGSRTIFVSSDGDLFVLLHCNGNHHCVGFLTLTGKGGKPLARRIRYVIGSHKTKRIRMRLLAGALGEISGGQELAARLRAGDLDGSTATRRVKLR